MPPKSEGIQIVRLTTTRQELIDVYRPAESGWRDAYELLQEEAERQIGIR